MYRLICIFFILFFCNSGFSQTITNYTIAHGLLDNFVQCIDVDINQNIWIGTPVGLQMFDGNSNWVTYNTSNSALVNDNIKVVTAMSNGDIWVGTDFGANKFDGTNWTTYDNSNGLISNQIKSIDENYLNNAYISIGTNLGVSYGDGIGSWNSFTTPDIHWSGVNSTSFSNYGVWYTHPLGGVTQFDGVYSVYDTSNGLISQNATSSLIDDYDNKWIGTGGGISVMDSSNSVVYNHTIMYVLPPPDTLNPVVDLQMDWDNRIWAAIYVGYLAQGGVAYWDGNQWTDFDDISDGLAGPNVRGLAIDTLAEIVWIATTTGISKISWLSSSVDNIINDELKIYPNPTTGRFEIVSSNKKLSYISVYNNLGVLVYSKNLYNNQKAEVDFSSFAKGIYNLTMNSKDSIIHRKIVIK
ncbi:MAG: T9SS type A sorting domain-containing protein [Bacteroidota bacterium]|nr:T9SS type A sorting domain-containing protein [Bacteroidota bacterium]